MRIKDLSHPERVLTQYCCYLMVYCYRIFCCYFFETLLAVPFQVVRFQIQIVTELIASRTIVIVIHFFHQTPYIK